MRAPAVPLITVDPYFSVWSFDETLNFTNARHWTGARMPILGLAVVDGKEKTFLGYDRNAKKMKQVSLSIEALTTTAVFEDGAVRLTATFFTPLLPDDIALLSRPVSYLSLVWEALDGAAHDVRVRFKVGEEICLDRAGESPAAFSEVNIAGIPTGRIGNSVQNVLSRDGDDVRIDWGYFYLSAVDPAARVWHEEKKIVPNVDKSSTYTTILAESAIPAGVDRVFLFSYDDVRSIQYFGKNLPSAWNKDGKTIETAIAEAAADYATLSVRVREFSAALRERAVRAGGEKYADLVTLAYRQVIAAHKVAVTENGEILFISKECFSNGCAATVDVTYPSAPLFLLYNTELLKGMLRPIYRMIEEPTWVYDFAPHDAGRYPLVNGQRYGLDRETGKWKDDKHMPVEECGNMLILEAAIARADGNADFAAGHLDTLKKWCEYLIRYGEDPENQLCTDDFAGHLAHNCNLSLKAIMGIEAMALLSAQTGDEKGAKHYRAVAEKLAKGWPERAANEDGTYRLAFDRPDTFSMKYNMVWDKLWGTGLFPARAFKKEFARYLELSGKYGMPLDSRADYTKSDWLVWCATLLPHRADFEKMVAPLWTAYDESRSRVPMTDWYDTVSAREVGFQHRSVQGGLFIKMMDEN